ncbi:hypothetical protein LTS18_012208, partial [Coniosporium uncinatum]
MFGDSFQKCLGLCPTPDYLKRQIPVTSMNPEVRVTVNHRVAICPHHGAKHSQQVAAGIFETDCKEGSVLLAVEVEDTFIPSIAAEWKLMG